MPIVTVRGRILPDGALQLDSAPGLPAGPVSVVIRTLNSANSGPAVGQDVVAGRKADEAATDMASYENLPDRDDH